MSKDLCEFWDKCWKRAYSQWLRDNYDAFDGISYPTRLDLFLGGLASSEMMGSFRTKSGKIRQRGIRCQKLPAKCAGWCPVMLGMPKTSCVEWQTANKYCHKSPTFRPWVSKEIRREVARRDKYTCVYCCRNYQSLKANGISIVTDHYIPLSLGGSSDAGNLVFCCKECNSIKGDDIWKVGCRTELVE